MDMADRIRRAERVLADLESDGRHRDAEELRRLFNEYAGEIRHLEARAALAVVLKANNEAVARNTGLLDHFEPFVRRLVEAEEKKARAVEAREKAKIAVLSKIDAAHILVTVVLGFGLVYALLGLPLPRVPDVFP